MLSTDPQLITQLSQLGTGALIVVVLWIVWQIFKTFMGKNGNGIKEQLRVMNDNHLNHLQQGINNTEQAIRDQTRLLQEDHQKQIQILTEIATILRERKR